MAEALCEVAPGPMHAPVHHTLLLARRPAEWFGVYLGPYLPTLLRVIPTKQGVLATKLT